MARTTEYHAQVAEIDSLLKVAYSLARRLEADRSKLEQAAKNMNPSTLAETEHWKMVAKGYGKQRDQMGDIKLRIEEITDITETII